ncbi:MAG: hypothetical protein IJB46_09795, partial [Prevotella sp.]|nr:hypothetical protein [Prevotella sp.]
DQTLHCKISMFTAGVKRHKAQDKGGCLSVRMSVIVSTCFLSVFIQRDRELKRFLVYPDMPYS